MKTVETPQTRCRAAIARADITPPVGIYHRMWGAAVHDRATGIHKPLLATLLWLEPLSGDSSQAVLIAALDHCILDGPDIEQMQTAVAASAGLTPTQVVIALAHTHAAGLMSRSRADQPGGDLIGPYLDQLAGQLGSLATQAKSKRQPGTIVYGRGCCRLAAHRDYFDAERNHFVCGLNPQGPADDMLLVARITGESGQSLATVVNYACHPTTLAWQNTLISPDYIGALRETVEAATDAPCLFLQGASGDLGPREGFVGDPDTADRNGKQLAYAALAALTALPPPNTRFAYTGPVISGATIGTWRHEPLDAEAMQRLSTWKIDRWHTPLAYRPDLPTVSDTKSQLELCQRDEQAAAVAGDANRARDLRARAEQMTRQLWRLSALPPNQFPLLVHLARLGDALWLFLPGEHYQSLQTALRGQFPNNPLIVATLSGGWQPGYIPPAKTFGRGIYQEQIAIVGAGSADQLFNDLQQHIQSLLDANP